VHFPTKQLLAADEIDSGRSPSQHLHRMQVQVCRQIRIDFQAQ
jgi:hypothetical protein